MCTLLSPILINELLLRDRQWRYHHAGMIYRLLTCSFYGIVWIHYEICVFCCGKEGGSLTENNPGTFRTLQFCHCGNTNLIKSGRLSKMKRSMETRTIRSITPHREPTMTPARSNIWINCLDTQLKSPLSYHWGGFCHVRNRVIPKKTNWYKNNAKKHNNEEIVIRKQT